VHNLFLGEINIIGWRRGVVVSELSWINVVNLHWARLLHGWVTAHGQVNRLGIRASHLGRLSLLPSVGRMVKWVSTFGLSHNDGDGGCSFLAAYMRVSGSSPWAWSKGRRPSGAVLHSSREPGVRRSCSDFMDMLRHLINCRVIIIIIIIIIEVV